MASGIGTGCVFCIKSKEEKAAIVGIVLKKSRKRVKSIIVRRNYKARIMPYVECVICPVCRNKERKKTRRKS